MQLRHFRLTILTIIFAGSLTLPGYTQATNKGLGKASVTSLDDLVAIIIRNIDRVDFEEKLDEILQNIAKTPGGDCKKLVRNLVSKTSRPNYTTSDFDKVYRKLSPCESLFRD